MFGSPALVDNLGRFGADSKLKLPSLRRVLCAGAPVRNDVLGRMEKLLDGNAQVFTPFGATECLPVASLGSHEALAYTAAKTAAGAGVCVGRPVREVEVRIIEIRDEPIAAWSADLVAKPGVVGEIAVAGPVVTTSYFRRDEQTALHKIADGGRTLHRMGDLGYFDEEGRLWMCGRKSHRVVASSGTLFTTQVEEIFNTHPAVRRTALVGRGARGAEIPVVLVERSPEATISDEDLLADLRELGSHHTVTSAITELAIYPDTFPVDRRHNAKIEREKLRAWVEQSRA
jgi:acyl-CoA synthetase (AMP-forming)/AMP-acid ligase II